MERVSIGMLATRIGLRPAAFDVALATSALVAGLGGLLLWLLMLRRAGRERRIRDTFYPLLPVVAPVPYLAGLIVVARQSRGVSGVSQGWFLVITSAGLVAAAAAAAMAGLFMWDAIPPVSTAPPCPGST